MYKKIIFIFLLSLILLVFLISCSPKSSVEKKEEASIISDEANQFTRLDQTAETSIVYPDPEGLVNDFAQIFTEEEKSEIENFLNEFLVEKDIAIVIVSVSSLGGLTIEKYANELFNTWGIGTETNDGILLLIAPNEGMLRIEVGISMEDEITNDTAKRIIDEKIIPYIKENKIGQGCYEGVKAITEEISSNSNK